MKQTQDAEDEHTGPQAGYLQLPAPVLALALVAFLGVLLAIGVYANANLRPQGVIVPTPGGPTAVVAASVVAPVSTATATQAPVAVGTSTPVRTSQPTQPATAVATATPERTPLVIALDATPTPMPTEVATPLPTVEPTLAAEVGQAYETYWRVSSQALLDLDSTHLGEVMEGPYLQSFESRLENLSASGRAIKTKVNLNYKVIQISDSLAVVVDRVEDDSYYVRAGSDVPLSDPASDLLQLEVKLKNDSGTWKVVESVSAD